MKRHLLIPPLNPNCLLICHLIADTSDTLKMYIFQQEKMVHFFVTVEKLDSDEHRSSLRSFCKIYIDAEFIFHLNCLENICNDQFLEALTHI